MADNVFSDAIVPLYTRKTIRDSVAISLATNATVAQLVYGFTIEAASANTAIVRIGAAGVANTAGIALAGGDTYTAPPLPGRVDPFQYDLSQWYARCASGTMTLNIISLVKRRQTGDM